MPKRLHVPARSKTHSIRSLCQFSRSASDSLASSFASASYRAYSSRARWRCCTAWRLSYWYERTRMPCLYWARWNFPPARVPQCGISMYRLPSWRSARASYGVPLARRTNVAAAAIASSKSCSRSLQITARRLA